MKTIIYLDMDGVLFDFMGGVSKVLKKDLTKIDIYSMGEFLGVTDQEIWDKINVYGAKFWADLEPYPWKDELIKLTLEVADSVFIATSPTAHPSCAMGKHQAILTKLPEKFHRKFFIGSAKQQFARDKNTILIDDNELNCTAFEKAGGRAILFPRTWNKNREYAHNPMKYVRAQLGQTLPMEFK